LQQQIYHIDTLKCSYDWKKTVLLIKELDIYKGTLNFVIGASGIGKSTFIETIGLMNNTIQNPSEVKLDFFNQEGASISLSDIWSKSQEKLAGFRNDAYSFIFQSTNLMSNFTAGENMCFGLLLAGETLEEGKKKVLPIMKSLNLDYELFDRSVTALSGGQRQRVAFVRAFAAKFDVLFGDEPTGNLDPKTSMHLMNILKSHLQQFHKTGIIVSHDVSLALDFADNIYFIKERIVGDESFGYLDNMQCFKRSEKGWMLNGEDVTNKIEQMIFDLM